MPPRAAEQAARQQAEERKQHGNELFARGKWSAAIEAYTEARLLCPTWEVPLVNRALCHRKRGHWDKVMEDCLGALKIDNELPKAHYMLGLAQIEMHKYIEAAKTLTKALECARNRGATMLDEIWHELARAKYAVWCAQATQRTQAADMLLGKVETTLRVAASAAIQAAQQQASEAAAGGPFPQQAAEQAVASQVAAIEAELQGALDGLRSTFQQARAEDVPGEIPDCYLCKLTMEPFRDPVVTPAGFTYERSALFQHFAKLGAFDPVSRQKIRPEQCVSNIAVRAATQAFLDSHGWAWGECIAAAPEQPR